jgi:hypothetical protein
MTNTATLSESQLRQFTGSENWYRHGINRAVLFTDGAKFLADQGGAYWLLDIIAIAQQHDLGDHLKAAIRYHFKTGHREAA